MIARTLWMNWRSSAVVFGLSIVFLAGCRSSGGGGRGCGSCRGQSCELDGTAYSPTALAEPKVDAVERRRATARLPVQLYAGQKTCPVTGEDLGSMGPAIPVTVRGDTIYVCCKGCAADVQRDPDPYLAKVQAERSGP